MRRVSIVGTSGSGKTTVGEAVSEAFDLPFIELDAIHHQPGWTELSAEAFQDRVRPIVAGDAWVIDGNYTSKGIQDLVWKRADTVVWLDLPRSVAMRRVIRRTIRRAATREELWNGNVEPWNNFFDPRPTKNIVVWTWTMHRRNREKYESRMADPLWSHLDVHRLRTEAEVDAFLAQLVAPGS
jgi:adenylate kinase family enzyme